MVERRLTKRKKGEKYPYMQFYTSDWIMATRILTDEEKSVWIDLLCFMWDNTKKRGHLEGCWADLARVVGRERLAFQICVESLKNKGVAVVEIVDKMGHESYITIKSSRQVEDANKLTNRHFRNKRYIESKDAYKTGRKTGHKTPLRPRQDGENQSQNQNQKSLESLKDKDSISQPLNGFETDYEPKPRKLTDVQKVVYVYKMVSGFKKEDTSWDKFHFARCTRSAKSLIEFLGSWKDAADCIDDVYGKLTSKGLTVTLETIVKHSADWKKDHQELTPEGVR